jgi:AraC-like DNA-binding protein
MRGLDAFSEILSGVTLKGALFYSAEFSAPWALHSPPSRTLTPVLAPGAPHLVLYHFVVEGTAHATLTAGGRLELAAGDVVVFPHGDSHELSGRESAAPIDASIVLAKILKRDLSVALWGGGGERTRFVCGYLSCDPLLCAPILDSLPAMFKVSIRTDASGQWLEQSILHLVEEASSNRAGSDAMLAKLSEALFVETVRRYVAGMSEEQHGWLAGSRDPVVGKSLALLHGRVQHPWTIAELAQTVGVSRSALVERFSRFSLEPPMAYLTGWRLRLAARALTTTPRGVAQIAADVGYESEAAFNRAFKRTFSVPPARYRRVHREVLADGADSPDA